ncbi:hypothetical protein PILCRDRAFT_376415 [Piloderma croceum F 1598]|uniref:Uncharacterized protein n=1 Tax=Piloderma croceum (strain F 1598) TaxID=765440 RepID=A0A0C3FZ20_PILCF|nr:hypothetical protein PILCRDRAFT_376415 [Piloderma croceum F 1598]
MRSVLHNVEDVSKWPSPVKRFAELRTNLFQPTLRQDHILSCPQGLLVSYVNLPRLHNPSSRMPVAIVYIQTHWQTYLTPCYPQSLNYVP